MSSLLAHYTQTLWWARGLFATGFNVVFSFLVVVFAFLVVVFAFLICFVFG